jgi:hypothetical protein
MNHPVDKRRRGLLHSLFLADPLRKLIAVGLAVGLWYYLDSQVSDTGELDLSLMAVEADNEPDTTGSDGDPNDLYVYVPPARWTVRGFENALTGQPILGVTLEFSGSKHLISRLREEHPRFRAHDPGVEDLEQQGGFEFSVENIRVASDFQSLIDRMTPSRVKVVLKINSFDQVALTPDRVEFMFPSGVGAGQLNVEQAVFSHGQITVFGPEEDLAALLRDPKPFEVSLAERAPDQFGGNLVLREEFDDFTMEPRNPMVSIPLQREPEFFDLRAPVVVDDRALPEERRGRYVAKEPTEDVRLAASGELEAILTSKTAQRQQEWADEFLRVYVRLRPGFTGTPDTQGGVLWVMDPGIDRQDYGQSPDWPVTIVEKPGGPGATNGK